MQKDRGLCGLSGEARHLPGSCLFCRGKLSAFFPFLMGHPAINTLRVHSHLFFILFGLLFTWIFTLCIPQLSCLLAKGTAHVGSWHSNPSTPLAWLFLSVISGCHVGTWCHMPTPLGGAVADFWKWQRSDGRNKDVIKVTTCKIWKCLSLLKLTVQTW